MPKTIEEWVTHLGVSPLPTMEPTARRFKLLIDRASSTNADYQKVIKHDPGFTLAIFRAFGRNSTLTESIHSVAHAISMLGIELVIDSTRRLPVLEELKPTMPHPGIYRCYSRAVHAAWYAFHLGQWTGDDNPNEMAIAALLHECGEMALWAHAEQEMQHIQRYVDKGMDRMDAARKVLGFSLGELSLAMAQRWGLPPLTIEALQGFGAFEKRPLGVILASAIAQASEEDWNSAKTIELYELTEDYLHLDANLIAARVHSLTASLAREIHELPLRTTAQDLLTVPTRSAEDEARESAEETAPPPAPTAPVTARPAKKKKAAPATPPPKPRAASAMDKGAQELLTQTMRRIRDEAGIKRAMFAPLSSKGDALKVRFVIGAEKDAPLRKFRLDLAEKSLFSILMAKPKGFWFNRENSAKYGALVPESLHETLNMEGFFAASVFLGKEPLGLLYADCSDADTLTEDDFSRFKKLAVKLSKELTAISPAS
ncbi:MAG: HDOD domain-containing protein [Sedimenticola sp.]